MKMKSGWVYYHGQKNLSKHNEIASKKTLLSKLEPTLHDNSLKSGIYRANVNSARKIISARTSTNPQINPTTERE
jgi:hypothetical protein